MSAILSPRETVLTAETIKPPMPVNVDGIPEELKQRSAWVNWRWDWNGKKWNKLPYQPDGYTLASSSDPDTWGTFEDVRESYERDPDLGIGIVFNSDGLIGIDLDDCRNPETGQVDGWAHDSSRDD